MMTRLLMLFVVSSLFEVSLSSDKEALFSNSWAVEIKGGLALADEIARKHDFINMGQVGSLDGIYHFVYNHSPVRTSRDVKEFHPKTLHLMSESQVGYVEQQVVKRRYKREYSYVSNSRWKDQWYLHRSSGHDMNVQTVWHLNVTGKGIVISILDDGIEYTHPDLQRNYDPLASYDFNDHDSDPIPRYDPTNENKHGTRCAGEVAAKVNGHCGVGVAYNSRVGGIRMLDGDVTDVVEASSLSLKPQHIHVYSSSWGPNDDGSTVDGPGKLASKAFVDGIRSGRNGLGSIFVWAAGNGGRYGDSCNCDGYAVSPLTISVGSASEHDNRPWYLEKCSSTLTSTYSSGDVGEKQIVTTDLHHSCTTRHTGTSASAPLAAGMIALALEVNVNLTWRDVQYLMVYASNPHYPHDDHWQLNGAGLKVSHWYGFGVLDGAALVNRARNWVAVPSRRNCTYNITNEAKKSDVVTSQSPLIINMEAVNCGLAYLEHVQAITSLQVQKGMRKDVSIYLTSPSSTKSVLLPFRSHDRHKDGFHSWPFMTVHSWGERPQGMWVFSVVVNSGASVKLESLELVLYGTASIPASVQSIPSQCHEQCLGGCARTGPQYCDNCKNYRVALTLECVAECPHGTYRNNRLCHPCPHLCAECDDLHSCNRCQPNSFLLPDASCFRHCPEGMFASPNNSCLPCHQSCFSCSGPLDANCTSCHPQFVLYKNVCKIRDPTSCPDGQYFDHRAHVCRLCHKSCLTCNGKESIHCTSCPEGSLDSGGQCIDSRQLRSCYSGQYYDGSISECAACPSTCKNCSNNHTCTSCQKGLYLTLHGTCVEKCPSNTTSDNVRFVCSSVDCHHSCKSCAGPLKNQCLSCFEGSVLSENECVQECPLGNYNDSGTCFPCATHNCASCTSRTVCSKCRSGYYLLGTNCVSGCPSGYVLHSSTTSCLPCPLHCAICSTPLSCKTCEPGYVYYAPDRSCQPNCPDGYYTSPTGLCNQCSRPCSMCSGSELNCTTCSAGMVMDKATAQCRHCCNPDTSASQCCDCSEDSNFCFWVNTTGVSTAPTNSSHTFTTLLYVSIGIVMLLAILLCLVLVVVLHCKVKSRPRTYHKVPSHEETIMIADDVSESETELYPTTNNANS